VAGRATRTPTRAEPKIGRPGGMPTISTVAQGGAQRSEQYLEAWTGEGARAADRQPAQVLQLGSPQGTGFANYGCASGATRASIGSPAASERHPSGRVGTDGAQVWERSEGDRPWVEEGVGAGGSAARPPVSRPESLRPGAILANGRARTTNRQRRPWARTECGSTEMASWSGA